MTSADGNDGPACGCVEVGILEAVEDEGDENCVGVGACAWSEAVVEAAVEAEAACLAASGERREHNRGRLAAHGYRNLRRLARRWHVQWPPIRHCYNSKSTSDAETGRRCASLPPRG